MGFDLLVDLLRSCANYTSRTFRNFCQLPRFNFKSERPSTGVVSSINK